MINELRLWIYKKHKSETFLGKVLFPFYILLRKYVRAIKIKSIGVCFLFRKKISNINYFERTLYSQSGEDGILEAIFYRIGTTNKFCVEFGVQTGTQCNTRYLREEKGWTGLLMDDGVENPKFIKKEFITAENINDLFKKYNVPNSFDLLSIDVDGNDYWIWNSLDRCYSPRVVIIEYNPLIPPSESKTIKYDPNFKWDGTAYCGASLLALVKLAQRKGYTLVGCNTFGVNAFFIRNNEIKDNFIIKNITELYRPWHGKVVSSENKMMEI